MMWYCIIGVKYVYHLQTSDDANETRGDQIFGRERVARDVLVEIGDFSMNETLLIMT